MLDRRSFLGSAVASVLVARRGNADATPSARRGGWPPEVLQDDEGYWRTLRREFLIPADEAFFNTGTIGSSPRVVIDTVMNHMTQVDATIAHWDYRAEHPDYFAGYRPELELREKIATLVGASAEEIALTQNATFGASYVASGLDLHPGDEVILTNQEHVGCESPWQLKAKRYGIYVKKVTVPVPPQNPQQLIELYLNATTPQTKVWAIPHLTSALAIRFPVNELCRIARERGIISVVDGAQCCGHLQLNLHEMGCDAYFSSPHKWLLAPQGCGFLYVSRERLPHLWATIASGQWDNYRDGAYRLMQVGTGNLSVLKGYEAAIDFHNRIGSARVTQRIVGLADRLRAGLRQIPQVIINSPQHQELVSATTVWSLAGYQAADLMDQLWARAKVRCRSMGSPWGVRQCCHIYNSPEEVDRTLETVRRMVAERR
ncbi:MAG: aminotransferase class V-fold PLP-dependent enzyme [Gemmatimonadota bacterium]|jgi:selenocysteine lyase/cysteine desulfurase